MPNVPFVNVKIAYEKPEPLIIEVAKKVFGEEKFFTLKRLNGGTTNQLFRVSVFQCKSDAETSPHSALRALVRINGNGTEKIIDRDREVQLLALAEKHGQTPHQYGRFANGLVYEYFPGRALRPLEMSALRAPIAKCLAKFHQIKIDYDRTPLLFKTLDQWITEARKILFEDPVRRKKFKTVNLALLEKEVHQWEQVMEGWKVCFCHNDLLSFNLIYDEEQDTMRFIDYEYCGYNYQAFDIGNHFFEYVGFDLKMDQYPTKEVQLDFLSSYLEEFNGCKPTNGQVETLYKQVNKASLLAHIFWALWGIVQANYSKITPDFDYLDYSLARLKLYFEWKDKMVAL